MEAPDAEQSRISEIANSFNRRQDWSFWLAKYLGVIALIHPKCELDVC